MLWILVKFLQNQLLMCLQVNSLKGTKTLQMLNQASWQETFLTLWLSSLWLVQQEHDLLEGPIPHLVALLCVLLCIVPLAIANVLRDASEFMLMPIQKQVGT